jgi:hypothetical protein
MLQDFNEVRSAHERFLTALKHQSLAHPPTLHGYMNLAMELSRRLSSLVKGACDNGLDLEQVQVRTHPHILTQHGAI